MKEPMKLDQWEKSVLLDVLESAVFAEHHYSDNLKLDLLMKVVEALEDGRGVA